MAARGNQLTSADDVRMTMGMLESIGFACRWSGLCVWIEGEVTKRAALDLLEMGARWSGKRGAWYFRADEGIELEGAAA